MKKQLGILFLLIVLFSMITSCDNSNSVASSSSTSSSEALTSTNHVIDSIKDVDQYSYIGIGAQSDDANERGIGNNYRLLGINRDHKAVPVRFSDSNGKIIEKEPFITAYLDTELYSFYKISFSNDTFCEKDFGKAKGDIYCIDRSTGNIYHMKGVTDMGTDFMNYDCFAGKYVGSFTVDGVKKLCLIYTSGNELKMEQKLSIQDFPEFQYVRLDREGNVFACESQRSFGTPITSHINNVKYILSKNDNITNCPQCGFFRAYNGIMYYMQKDKHDLQSNDNFARTAKEKLLEWNELYNQKVASEVIECLPSISHNEFVPPELSAEKTGVAYNEAQWTLGDSQFLYSQGDTYYFLTKIHDITPISFFISKIEYLNQEKTKYSLDIFENNAQGYTKEYFYYHDYQYFNKKVFILYNQSLIVIDLESGTSNAINDPKIVKYHSLQKIDSNLLAVEATSTSLERVLFIINSDTLEMTKIESSPRYTSVSFLPMDVQV